MFAPYGGATSTGPGGTNVQLTNLFSLALHHQVVLDGIIAFTLCAITDCTHPDSPIKRLMWQHRGNAIRGLQARLDSPQLSSDDAAIHTTLTLVSVEVRYYLSRSFPEAEALPAYGWRY